MIKPSTTTDNLQEVNHAQHSSPTSQSLISVPHPLPPPAKRMLFEIPPTSISNKRITEENHLHGIAGNSILALSGLAVPAINCKEKGSSNNMKLGWLLKQLIGLELDQVEANETEGDGAEGGEWLCSEVQGRPIAVVE
ncbi:Uncharacterized protein Fot_14334 [Forsythia ovata]|uniref:Uncharacterized protein n=1 Tax=Forsythia ovata TaxID=205694 RepID=A0ABD1W615_9LAMI